MWNGSVRFSQLAVCVAFVIVVYSSSCYCQLDAAQLSSTTEGINVDDLNDLRNHYVTHAKPEHVHRMLQQKCQNANEDSPDSSVNVTQLGVNLQMAAGRLVQCVTDIVNITVVMAEVAEASPRGDVDLVFEKYCLRLPNATSCISEFSTAMLPCLTREERAHNVIIQRILGKLLEFVCYKDGDQIALFVAEEGPECLEKHKDNIGKCFRDILGHYLPNQLDVSQMKLPDFVLGPKQCVEIHDFETCVLRHLETCSNITPSNVVESMFRYIRKETKCHLTINRVIRERTEALVLKSGAATGVPAAAALPLFLAIALSSI